MRGGEGEGGKCYMLWAHNWACPATRWWLSSNDEARRRHGWKLATSISYKFVFLYFLNLYLCQRYFPGRAQKVGLGEDDEARRRVTQMKVGAKLGMRWEYFVNISTGFISPFWLYFCHLISCISSSRSNVFLWGQTVAQMKVTGWRWIWDGAALLSRSPTAAAEHDGRKYKYNYKYKYKNKKLQIQIQTNTNINKYKYKSIQI